MLCTQCHSAICDCAAGVNPVKIESCVTEIESHKSICLSQPDTGHPELALGSSGRSR